MSLVLFEQSNPGVGLITLNDSPSLNAMSEAMAAEFAALTATLANLSEKPRVLILTGAGRAFSAGGDLEMLDKKRTATAEENRQRMLEFYFSFLGILDLRIPLIAALNGHAIGAGLCLAAACDIRIAAGDAKLGFTFTRLGLHPGMGASWFLPRVVGHARASELLLTARIVPAKEAQLFGLVSRVVEPESTVVEEAKKIATEICLSGPESIKQLVETIRGDSSQLRKALEREADCQAVNYAGKEFAEGILAAKEKRKAFF